MTLSPLSPVQRASTSPAPPAASEHVGDATLRVATHEGAAHSLSTTPLASPTVGSPHNVNSLGLLVSSLGDVPRSTSASGPDASVSATAPLPIHYPSRPSLGHRSISSCSSVASVSTVASGLDVGGEHDALPAHLDFFSPAYSHSSGSVSDLSDNDAASVSTGGSFTRPLPPCDSPFAMTRSISGLFIGTPDNERRTLTLQAEASAAASRRSGSPPMMQQHPHLLALSHGDEHGNGAGSSMHRSSSLNSMGLYSLSAPPMPLHLRHRDGDGADCESTPMPPSSGTFEGHAPSAALHSRQTSSVSTSSHHDVFGPASGISLHSRIPDSVHGTPASVSSISSSSHGDFSSPFERSSGHQRLHSALGDHFGNRLRRTDSIDSFNTSVAASPFEDRNPIRSIGEASGHGDGSPLNQFKGQGRFAMPSSAAAMSRISSAPGYGSPVPGPASTPSRPTVQRHKTVASLSHGPGTFAVPSTPASASRKPPAEQLAQTPASTKSSHHTQTIELSPLSIPSTPLDRRVMMTMPQSAPHTQYGYGELESPVAVESASASVGKAKRHRKRASGPPPLIVSSVDKVHVCWCGKKFKRMEHLKRHNKVHTQEKPFACTFPGCQKAFGRSDNLSQHLKTHYRPNGFSAMSQAHLLAAAHNINHLTQGSEAKHDPHAAATAAAAAAAAISANMGSLQGQGEGQQSEGRFGTDMRRRSTVSEGVPIQPQQQQQHEHLGAPFAFTMDFQKHVVPAPQVELVPHFDPHYQQPHQQQSHQQQQEHEPHFSMRQPLGPISGNTSGQDAGSAAAPQQQGLWA